MLKNEHSVNFILFFLYAPGFNTAKPYALNDRGTVDIYRAIGYAKMHYSIGPLGREVS